MKEKFYYKINSIPDPGDNSLAASIGGNVTQKSFKAAEQFLRILSNMEADQFSATLRFYYNPIKYGQSRTQIEIELTSQTKGSNELWEKLINSGPFSSIYEFEKIESSSIPVYNTFTVLSEVVKQEKVYSPFIRGYMENFAPGQISSEDIVHIPQIYYSVKNFEIFEENDWMNIDNLLDKFDKDILIEVYVSPTQSVNELKTFNTYIKLNNVLEQIQQNKIGFDNTFHDPFADEVSKLHEETYQTFQKPLMNFSIRCWGYSGYDSQLVASTIAENCFANGNYTIISISENDTQWPIQIDSYNNNELNYAFNDKVVWNIIDDIIQTDPTKSKYRDFLKFSRLASVDELLGIFRLPVGKSHASPKTIRRHTDPKPFDEEKESILIGDDLELGKSKERDYSKFESLDEAFNKLNPEYHEMRFDKELLKKHMFIAGVPGSGKTTAMNNLLTQFAHMRIPLKFLVIEPAKTEYRLFKKFKCHPDPVIKEMAENLQIYTVGNEEISPFRFNPLAYPEGVTLDEHISTVLACFEASLPLGGPLKALLAEAIEEVYENIPIGKKFPRLQDLVSSAKKIIEIKGYDSEVKSNLKAMLEVRLGLLVRRSLGKVFDCDEGFPSINDMFKENIILEMDYLSSEHASLMSLFVLSSLREYIKINRNSGASLQHLILLEEAHNIVGRTGQATSSEEGADPKAFAANYVSRMLAELRALGEGIIIADQLPTAVAPEVVKNTGTKLAHRLVSTDDREDLGAAMLLDETQVEDLARLQVGEAYFYSEGLFRPRRVRALNSTAYLSLGQKEKDKNGNPVFPESPNKLELIDIIKNEKWYLDSNRSRHLNEIDNINFIKFEANKIYSNGSEILQKVRDDFRTFSEINTPDNLTKRNIRRNFDLINIELEKVKGIIKELELVMEKKLTKRVTFFFSDDLKETSKNLLKEIIKVKNDLSSILLSQLKEYHNKIDKLIITKNI